MNSAIHTTQRALRSAIPFVVFEEHGENFSPGDSDGSSETTGRQFTVSIKSKILLLEIPVATQISWILARPPIGYPSEARSRSESSRLSLSLDKACSASALASPGPCCAWGSVFSDVFFFVHGRCTEPTVVVCSSGSAIADFSVMRRPSQTRLVNLLAAAH